jgi:hypothetical protein
VNINQDSNPATKQNMRFSIRQTLKKIIHCLLIIAQSFTPIATVYVIWKTNTLTNTANLLQLNTVIQARTDVFYSVELKRKEIAMENDHTFEQAELSWEERKNALSSLLNIYEFACQQYISKKIDRKAFKLFYNEWIKEIMLKHLNQYGEELYPAIRKVYREWHFR